MRERTATTGAESVTPTSSLTLDTELKIGSSIANNNSAPGGNGSWADWSSVSDQSYRRTASALHTHSRRRCSPLNCRTLVSPPELTSSTTAVMKDTDNARLACVPVINVKCRNIRHPAMKSSACRTRKKPFFSYSIYTSWLFYGIALFLVLTSVSMVNAIKLRPNTETIIARDSEVCQSVDIRNSPETFQKLRGCRVVEGFVQILLFDTAEEAMYSNITFPELTEITGYLLLYRVNGLRSLGKMFPNLAVIRGQTLFFNYAFVVFEMSSLQEIGLYSLTDIVNGLVRIDKNPSLCYVNTIDWELIAHEKGEHFIRSNKLENECPICPGDDGKDQGAKKCPKAGHKDRLITGPKAGRHLCWNRNNCQKVCSDECKGSCNENKECCAESCLGGCKGAKRDECTVCRNLSIGSGKDRKCLQKCPVDTYKFKNRRCIQRSECYNMIRPPDLDKPDIDESDEKPYKTFNGSCLLYCPVNYYETKLADGNRTCEPCKGMCRKDCQGANVDGISSAQQLRGCTHIRGPLEIQIRGGRNVVKELEDNLNMIEEIDGYLKIVRSFPIVSLNFLKNLRVIHGNTLESQKYVFVVLDNQNLQELWDWETKRNHSLQIKNGRLFFHFNPKLCLYKIERLKLVANLGEFTDLEVAPSSNGDKVACNVTELEVKINSIQSTVVILKWQKFKMDDDRSLLGYVVYSTEAPKRNITLYDGRDACGGDGWRVDDVGNPAELGVEVYHILTHLKPYTQYAFYVKTYTIATERSGAQSPISYFRTNPDVPSIPVNLRVHAESSEKLIIQWQPPLAPNGNVTHYEIVAAWEQDDPSFLQQRNYCTEPLSAIPEEKKTVDHYKIKVEETTSEEANDSCSCDDSDLKDTSKDEQENERQSQINFENELHNRVYIKRPTEGRRKREITFKDIQAAANRYTTDKNDKNVFPDSNHEQLYVTYENSNDDNINGSFSHKNITTNTTYVMDKLHHFAKYSISVRACRERESTIDDTGQNCSTKSIVTARTLKADGVDTVSNMKVLYNQMSNQSLGEVRLTWEEPTEPNGIILTYQIEYLRVDIKNYKAQVECITQQMFIDSKKQYTLFLPAGNYSVRVSATSLAGNGIYSPYYYFYIQEPSTNSTTTTVIGIIVACLFLIIIGVAYFVWKRYSQSVPNMKLIASVNPEYVSTAYVPDDWEVPRRKIEFLRELGQGSFGMVYEGIARDVVKGKPEMRCAIKTVNEHATDRERIEFLNEASVMKAFDTTHVVRLLGVVSQGQPTLVVMELMANGDLKSYLRSHRPDAESYNVSSNRLPPTLKRILQMAIEIADGMAYLAAKKFVHRDLAARNCMVAEDLTVKIGDFGMTRDIYETDYYRKGTKGLLPVRWMAPESLKDGVFTSSSDAWSYGVVLWEMATLASQPYQGLSNDQVLRYVIDGGIMERPENCPDKLYTLMRVCWQHKPLSRPSFLDLATMLLEDANGNFEKVSFYHSPAGVEARTVHNSAQDDPSTPLRHTKELEDFSLGSGSDQDSEPEGLGDDAVNSDIDGENVIINFPRFQAASYKDNQKSVDTSGPSLFSYKDNGRSQDTSGPSLCSYNEQPRSMDSNDSRSLSRLHHDFKRSSSSLQGVRPGMLGKDTDGSGEGSGTATATANGYVGGRPINGTTAKTTQC